MRVFELLNKDVLVYKFAIERNVLGLSYSLLETGAAVPPITLRDMNEWLNSRYVLSHRRHIASLFSSVGIQDLEDFIVITNCVAVTDTYWVREAGSHLSWSNVSPYRNSLNKVISEYSLTGVSPSGTCLTGSPDFSTDGTFPKCWRRHDSILELCKAGTEGYSNAGLEPYSEVFAYQLANYLSFNAVPYRLGRYKSKLVSICPNMCSEDVGFVSLRYWTGVESTDFE